MKTRRPYVMRARAEAAEATRRRVLDAAAALYWERFSRDFTLEDVAERAGVAVQTVLRAFGSRAQLMEEAGELIRRGLREERWSPPGDVEAGVAAIFDHYERRGRGVIGMLARESVTGEPDMSEGRALHRRWVEEAFGPQLTRRDAAARDAAVDQLVVATDVYTWKLLRLDRGLDRPEAEARVRSMIAAILAEG